MAKWLQWLGVETTCLTHKKDVICMLSLPHILCYYSWDASKAAQFHSSLAALPVNCSFMNYFHYIYYQLYLNIHRQGQSWFMMEIWFNYSFHPFGQSYCSAHSGERACANMLSSCSDKTVEQREARITNKKKAFMTSIT